MDYMLSLNENEIINKFLNKIEPEAKRLFGITPKVKKLNIAKPEPTEIYKKYQGGKSSISVDVNFELMGWQSYSDNGLEAFLKSLLEEDDSFFSVVDLKVFELTSKGKTNVQLQFEFVFTRVDVMDELKGDAKIVIGAEKDNIIREIEIKLSEIYTLLKKLK